MKTSFRRKYGKVVSAFEFSLGHLLIILCLGANPLTSLEFIFLVSTIGIMVPTYLDLPWVTTENYWAGIQTCIYLFDSENTDLVISIMLSLESSYVKLNVPSAAKSPQLASY